MKRRGSTRSGGKAARTAVTKDASRRRPRRREPGGTTGKGPAVGVLHGYLLDGSGSNLWTRNLVRTFCRAGATVHLMCQEPHAEEHDFIARAIHYDRTLTPSTVLSRDVNYPGECILHKPTLGGVLPVYVGDRYEEHDRVVPMPDLDDRAIEDYVRCNVEVLERIVSEHHIAALLANHAVLMPTVAQRVAETHSIPFVVVPHGSAIEYAVKKDARLHRLAARSFERAQRLLVIGPEMRRRVRSLFNDIVGLDQKMVQIRLGVDAELFAPIHPRLRGESIARLKMMLRGTRRGKSPGLSATMRRRLKNAILPDEMSRAVREASDYEGKHPDADCESRLDGVDWKNETILLYVGRLIGGKGIHSVVAALPLILRRQPDTRLVVVGHGPARETLEAMLAALDTGNSGLFRQIVARAHDLEGTSFSEPLIHVQRFLEQLEDRGEMDDYFQAAQTVRVGERVIFTGYLSHRELRHLFPCCDVALFPSIVAEAGPLVFLEAMSSGVFPMGVYSAGLAASIDSLADVIPPDVADLMKLRADPDHLVGDMVSHVPEACRLGRSHAGDLRRAVVERHDLDAGGRGILDLLRGLSAR